MHEVKVPFSMSEFYRSNIPTHILYDYEVKRYKGMDSYMIIG